MLTQWAGALDGLALEAGFFGVGEGALGGEGCSGWAGCGLGSGLGVSGFLAHGLVFLRFAAEAADLEGAGFGDEVVHAGIFSWAVGG